MREAAIDRPDGRRLAFAEIGERGWPAIMFFHGAPSSRLRLSYLEAGLIAARLHVVSADRPGYGGSSTYPGRTLEDWPEDVAAIAQELGIDRFAVAGHSSGGAYAVATAALLPDRVIACITLGGVTDMGWSGAWDGYNAMEAALMRLSEGSAVLGRCVELFGEDGAGFMAASGFDLPPPDAALYEDPHTGALLAAAREEAFRQGVVGYAQDVIAQAQPWAFDPAAVRCPVVIAHGEQDMVLPIAHARHTAEVVPGAALRLLAEHGHFSLLGELPALVAPLLRTPA